MVELKNVSVTYSSGRNKVDALNNVSLKINDGEFAFIVGASGAGKSTLTRLLIKQIEPNEGEITVNGFDLNRLKRRKIPALRRTIGFVFQDLMLIPNMSVYDNIAFVLRAIDAPKKYIRSRVPYVISLMDLVDKAKANVNDLSGGERQRVAIARALVNNPQLIIADEPTGNVDPEHTYDIVDLLQDINRQAGTTVIMITHDHEVVKQYGGRVINLENGCITFDDMIYGGEA